VHSSSAVRIVLGAAIALVVLAGCAQKRTTSSARSAAPKVAPPQEEPSPAAEPAEKAPRIREAGVYVDGKQVGVLRSQELPLSIKTIVIHGAPGVEIHLWSFVDYAKSVGIDPAKVKSLQIHGGKRIATVDHDELAALGDQIRFNFTQDTRGKPKMTWAPKSKNPTVDMISAVAFYVEKEPPTYKDGLLYMPDGSVAAQNKMPYEAPDANSGTRVYVDGNLVGAVKRKKLTNDLLVSKEDETSRFGLMKFAATLGVDPKQTKEVDLLAGDDVIARITTEPKATATSFRVPQRNQGKILVDLPEGSAKVSAVQIYVKTKPPVRAVTKLDDAPSAAPGNGNGNGAGSNSESDDEG
jgi:hypothetical protein